MQIDSLSTNWRRSIKTQLNMKSGGHGEHFRFLPLVRGTNEDHFPRIIKIAGVYPDITLEQLLAPTSNPASAVGTWSYDFSDPEGPQLGTVAIPGSSVVTDCIDPVVLIAKNTDLGVSSVEDYEMLVVIDRKDKEFSREHFYLFKTPENNMLIQWCDNIPNRFEIVGKVAVCFTPYLKSMQPKRTGWLEDDEE
jgi:hypothetical protein